MRWALGLAAVVLLAGTLAQLLHGAPRQTGSNDLAPQNFAVEAPARVGACQGGETLYAGTRTVRLTVATFGKPTTGPLTVTYSDGDRVLARGRAAPGWSEGEQAIVLEPAPPKHVPGVEVCVRADQPGRLAFGGEQVGPEVAATVRGEPTAGAISLVSWAAGRPSLLEVAGDVLDRYERGNSSLLGGWTWILMIALTLGGLAAAGAAIAAREHGARLAVVAALALGTTWALLIPPFMVPDETAHVAYVQGMVETGELPADRPGNGPISPREADLLVGLNFFGVIGHATSKPAWTPAEEAAVREAERSRASRATLGAGTASSNPPLYYLALAPAYAATRGLSLLDALLVMRLVSVLLTGLTVLCVFYFLREVLPSTPVAWPIGAVAVALQPLFGYIGAGVNADAALFAASAAAFWAMAVVLRRGLTLRRGMALGAVIAAGLLTKPLFLGLVPAALLALAVGAVRLDASWGRRAALAAATVAVAFTPVVAYSVVGDALSDHPYFPNGVVAGSGAAAGPGEPEGLAGLRKEGSYIWQLFLPRLPFMEDHFPGTLPLRSVWFDGFVGYFGWLDYGFAGWVTGLGVWLALGVLVLAGAALVRSRDRLRARWAEIACSVLAVAGVAGAIGVQQYNTTLTGAPALTQARYLLPLLALYAALVALATRGLGRTRAPYLGAAVLAIVGLHVVAALILTVTRYYA